MPPVAPVSSVAPMAAVPPAMEHLVPIPARAMGLSVSGASVRFVPMMPHVALVSYAGPMDVVSPLGTPCLAMRVKSICNLVNDCREAPALVEPVPAGVQGCWAYSAC